ncbi:MAG: hypothetical protein FGF53_00735 [Candidatus Brockarchaeota archaeon]|nr:hypothetical protein [Candidatus Brockarchaeota archaeon]MBO3808002.1 hypothetical protein [Candidatus Brockarchaeota archaeon]
MGFEHEEGRRILFRFIEDNPEYIILSDPDLDGIFAASITAKALGGDFSRIHYPKPSEIDTVKACRSILIELPLSKGLTYVGSNVLLDHHGPAPLIALYNGSKKTEEILFNSGLRSVSRLIFEVFRDLLELNEEGIRMLEAVDEIDSGNMVSELAVKMNKAFLLNSMREDVRSSLSRMVYESDWSSILQWVEGELSRWSLVENMIEKLRGSLGRIGSITYFTYDVTDQLEAAARRMLMFELGGSEKVVVCVGLRKGKPVSATIAARGLDLNKVYVELLKNNGVKAGGRSNIGGIQFKQEINLEDALNLIRMAVEGEG